jgi:hypothetical protein
MSILVLAVGFVYPQSPQERLNLDIKPRQQSVGFSPPERDLNFNSSGLKRKSFTTFK